MPFGRTLLRVLENKLRYGNSYQYRFSGEELDHLDKFGIDVPSWPSEEELILVSLRYVCYSPMTPFKGSLAADLVRILREHGLVQRTEV